MKKINVPIIEDHDVARQYDGSFYSADGLYLWKNGMSLVLVSCGAVTCLFSGIDTSIMRDVSGEITEGIKESTLLKAIAVACDPSVISKMDLS